MSNDEILKLLKRLEWASNKATPAGYRTYACPCCGAGAGNHLDSCKLNEAITTLEFEKQNKHDKSPSIRPST